MGRCFNYGTSEGGRRLSQTLTLTLGLAVGCSAASPQVEADAGAADSSEVGASDPTSADGNAQARGTAIGTTSSVGVKGGEIRSIPDLTGVSLPPNVASTVQSDQMTISKIDADESTNPQAFDGSPLGQQCAALAHQRLQVDARRRSTSGWSDVVKSAGFKALSAEIATFSALQCVETISQLNLEDMKFKQCYLLQKTIETDSKTLTDTVAAIAFDMQGISEVPPGSDPTAWPTSLEQCELVYTVSQTKKAVRVSVPVRD